MEEGILTTPAAARRPKFLGGAPAQLLIGGQWRPALSGETFQTVNPATEEVMGEAAAGDSADIEIAVRAARRALTSPGWTGMTPHQRGALLLNIADAIERHQEELAEIETLDNGMPFTAARGHVAGAVQCFRYYAGWPTKVYGDTNPSAAGIFNYTRREPIGVCGAIIPWNAPLLMAAWKIAPALAFGNTVILKPAEQTPLSALRLGQLLMDVGVPAGVVNIVTGYGNTAGEAISLHPDIDKVAFTGSTAVGKGILRASAGSLKRVTLELGGKSPNIIFPDADLDRAISAALRGFCHNSGQICAAGTRIYVHQSIHDQVVEVLSAQISRYRIGDPFAADTTMGPLVSKVQYDRVCAYIRVAKEEGASAHVHEAVGILRSGGFFVSPTLFSDVTNNMRIAREEVFGPVAAIIPFKDEDDAVLQANDTDYGLAAGVWTRDFSRAHRVANAMRAGTVWINTYLASDPITAFGGYKQSGIGREHGPAAIEAYTQIKSVYAQL